MTTNLKRSIGKYEKNENEQAKPLVKRTDRKKFAFGRNTKKRLFIFLNKTR